jgi:hypothetical protein
MKHKLFRHSNLVALLALSSLCSVAFFGWQTWVTPETHGDAMYVCGTHGEQGVEVVAPDYRREARVNRPISDPAVVDTAFNFLNAQMDLYNRSTIIYSKLGFSFYYPSGKMGDVEDITIDADVSDKVQTGRSSLRINYQPKRTGGQGWAGIYFLYPDGNWGQFPGRDLSGATKLTFWACANQNMRAEFFIGGIRDPRLPYSDSLTKVSTGEVAVTSTWHRYEIDLKGRDLSSVIGGFGLATNRDQDSSARSLFLDDIAVDLSSLDEPRFIQSYVPGNCPDGGLPNTAQIYDQALVLLAFLARAQADDLKRAELIARALVEAQLKDRTFKDGRLRNAYASGELIDPHFGTTRIPGALDQTRRKYFEDENAVGTDTGNMAWVALALLHAHVLLPKRAGAPYLTAALSLAKWVVRNTRVTDTLGGFAGGVQGFEAAAGNPEGQQRKDYRATEHNIDLEALFDNLAAAVGQDSAEGQSWSAEAAHARLFVDKMRNPVADAPYFWTGTTGGVSINKAAIPLDAQTWSVLRTRDPSPYGSALDWALQHCTEKGSSDAFDFNCNDGDGAWWEGTAQVAAALRWLKREQDVAPVLARLQNAQLKAGTSAGAIPAASRCGLTTGFDLSFRSGKTMPWLYPNLPHIGATAWFIFAQLGVNPYFVK